MVNPGLIFFLQYLQVFKSGMVVYLLVIINQLLSTLQKDIDSEWCIQVIENPIKMDAQEHYRFRFWGMITGLEGRVLRVITLED